MCSAMAAVQLTTKNAGVYWQEFLSGQTRGGRALTHKELGVLGEAFIEYTKGMTTKGKAAKKMHMIRDRLNELGLSSILDQQRAISNDLADQGELIDEVERVQQEALHKIQVLKTKHAATRKRAHDAATATSSHMQQQQEVSQDCTDAAALADAANEALHDSMQATIGAERAKHPVIVKGCRQVAIAAEEKLRSEHEKEVTALNEQVKAERNKRRKVQAQKKKADVQGIKLIQAQHAALQEMNSKNEQLQQTNSGLADHLQKLENSLADKLFPDPATEPTGATESGSDPATNPTGATESSSESGSESGSESADDDALRSSLQQEMKMRFANMSSAEQKEWFRTRMQDPDFVARIEKGQREMEEYNSEEAEESDDDA